MATTLTITEKAKTLGGNSADAYFEEFGRAPRTDGAEQVGDWDSAAWQTAWHELMDAGATEADYEACLAAWREGFWSTFA